MSILKILKDRPNISICIMRASISSKIQELIKNELSINKIILADKKDYRIRSRINRVNKDLKEDIKDSKLLIGTQAIEVSLDISYDVLYTQLCPLDSLLQRLGRVNRKGKKGIANIYCTLIYIQKIERKNVMLENIFKKHIANLIKNDKEYALEYLKKEFVGVATYIDSSDFEFTINNFCGYDDFDNHIANFNNILKELENKKEKAIKIYNLKVEELYLVAEYLTLEEIDLALSGDSEIDKEFWELYADISELMGRKVVRDEQGNCIEVSYN